MSYKAWYLDMVYYAAKLKEKFNYEYTGGNPKRQLTIFHLTKDKKWLITQSATEGELTLLKYLVDQGANIHSYALYGAASNGHLDVVKYLVNQGANIHDNDEYALRSACENGHLDVVKYLVERGADIHALDDDALGWASQNGHLEVVEYLKSLP